MAPVLSNRPLLSRSSLETDEEDQGSEDCIRQGSGASRDTVSTAVAMDLDVRPMDAIRPRLTSTLMVPDRSRAPKMISREPITNRNIASAIALYGTAGGLFLNWKALKY
ncbi:hypothetical protein EYF80_043418 [Liparis tanakae]|uniref:Uncharacterized protein n=1 Tax=Liparis tanakae TaxID=230148 RepID=A0A4Z2FZW4_9TELE|nr:hypothetical protein EYF80_043418 [Liparis tanakae]